MSIYLTTDKKDNSRIRFLKKVIAKLSSDDVIELLKTEEIDVLSDMCAFCPMEIAQLKLDYDKQSVLSIVASNYSDSSISRVFAHKIFVDLMRGLVNENFSKEIQHIEKMQGEDRVYTKPMFKKLKHAVEIANETNKILLRSLLS